jgi:hypothetical protein
MRGREPGEHQLDQQLGRKSVREHERLGAAVGRGGEQFKGAATVGLGAAGDGGEGGITGTGMSIRFNRTFLPSR